MLDTVKRTISDYMMLETGENVLVALSGGADSMCLLHLLHTWAESARAGVSCAGISPQPLSARCRVRPGRSLLPQAV